MNDKYERKALLKVRKQLTELVDNYHKNADHSIAWILEKTLEDVNDKLNKLTGN